MIEPSPSYKSLEPPLLSPQNTVTFVALRALRQVVRSPALPIPNLKHCPAGRPNRRTGRRAKMNSKKKIRERKRGSRKGRRRKTTGCLSVRIIRYYFPGERKRPARYFRRGRAQGTCTRRAGR